jgi:hypothetical protein
VLGGMFGSKREEVAGGWRELCYEAVVELYCSPDVMGMG